MKRILKCGLCVVLIFYLIVLTKVIVLKYYSFSEAMEHLKHFTWNDIAKGWDSANFIPFQTTIEYYFYADIPIIAKCKTLAEYIIAFAPLGAMLPLLSNRFLNFRYIILSSTIIGLLFELIQGIFKFGVFNVDDIMLYIAGTVIGFCLVWTGTYLHLLQEKKLVQKVKLNRAKQVKCKGEDTFQAYQ